MTEVKTPIVVVDTETGGLDPDRNAILEVALVGYLDYPFTDPATGAAVRELRSCRFYVKGDPGERDPRAAKVHGISDERIEAEGLTPDDACDKIEKFLERFEVPSEGIQYPLIAAHHVVFDMGFVRRLYRLAGREMPGCFGWRTIDTFALLAAGGHETSLDRALAEFGLEPRVPDAHHSAVVDATKTLQLLTLLAPKLF